MNYYIMPSDISDYSILELQALFLLSRKAMHGYELMQLLGAKRKKKVTAGTLYPILKKLKGRGLIKLKQAKGNNRGKKVYELSVEGRKELRKAGRELTGFLNDLIAEFRCSYCGSKGR
ncbi:PadR family transcriptional regulator [archaeon]|nr:PadR family transcriptional regulator [archaeon]